METEYALRVVAIHLLQHGRTPTEVSRELGRSRVWVHKWWRRFHQNQSWQDLRDQSRRPKHCPHRLSEEVIRAICQVRQELEAEADFPQHLGYIGAPAIQNRLQQQGLVSPPSHASNERVLARAGWPHAHPASLPEVHYPHLRPNRPHQLIQVDIVPHFLPGGTCVSCFNAIDPVSHYASGLQSTSKNAQVAMQFLLQVWYEQGLSRYTQLDNESCFSGGTAHPRVLSKVVRLCLYVGTQPVFTPFYHPESNGCVECFHQDYNRHTCQKFTLTDLEEVQSTSAAFFERFRHSHHIQALAGKSPEDVQRSIPALRLPAQLALPGKKLPLTAGQVHFIRRVGADRNVSILYEPWLVPHAQEGQGIWATLAFQVPDQAELRFFDAAPDAASRTCLGQFPFPLQEPVLPLSQAFQPPTGVSPSRFAPKTPPLPGGHRSSSAGSGVNDGWRVIRFC